MSFVDGEPKQELALLLQSNEREERLPPASAPRPQLKLHCNSHSVQRLRHILYGPGLETRQTRRFFSPPKRPDPTDGIPTMTE